MDSEIKVNGVPLSEVSDESLLSKLVNSTEDFETRKQLRARLQQVKSGPRAKRVDDIGSHREQLIQQRQRDAAESKARTLAMYDNMAKSGNAGDTKALDINTYRVESDAKATNQQVATAASNNLDDLGDLAAALSSGSTAKTSPIKGRPTNPKDALLHWCYMKTRNYDNVYVQNFSSSWSDGLAFCALLHHFFPKDIDYAKLSSQTKRENFELAFKVAEEKAKVYPLLETEDMIKMGDKPDWKCVYTYVQALYRGLKPFDPTQK